MNAPLTPAALHSRLRFDFEVVSGLQAPWLHVLGFASLADLLAGRDPIAPSTPGAAPPFLLARYDFLTLAGPGATRTPTYIALDLLALGNYPFTPPVVTALAPYPWIPRVHPTVGVLCTGASWQEAGGRMLVAHLLVQVARLLNLDEPHSGTDLGYQSDATRYWQRELGGRPLHPELRYPALPVEVTHGAAAPRPKFRPLTPASPTRPGFRVKGPR